MIRILAAMLAASTLIFAHASAGPIKTYNVAGWNIAVQADTAGRFASCVASANYAGDLTLHFMIDANLQWYIAVDTPESRLGYRSEVDVAFKIDESEIYYYRGLYTDRRLMVKLTKEAAIFHGLRRGKRLNIVVVDRAEGFELTGTSRMLMALASCVDSQGRTISTPQVAAAPRAKSAAAPSASSRPDEVPLFTGSGFFVSTSGIGITNAHVLEGCADAVISTYGKARIVARDEANDLALIRLIQPTETYAAKIRKKPLQLGETVFVMGFPLAGQLDNGLNFTSGLVSSLAGIGNNSRMLQFTAPVQAGNSGGPVVDNSGLVVGVVQSKLDEVTSLKASGSLPQNINFGLKADLVANFMRANGAEPVEVEALPVQEATAVAAGGRGYAFQVKCTPQ
jgi:S1-C subfamily serine protease